MCRKLVGPGVVSVQSSRKAPTATRCALISTGCRAVLWDGATSPCSCGEHAPPAMVHMRNVAKAAHHALHTDLQGRRAPCSGHSAGMMTSGTGALLQLWPVVLCLGTYLVPDPRLIHQRHPADGDSEDGGHQLGDVHEGLVCRQSGGRGSAEESWSSGLHMRYRQVPDSLQAPEQARGGHCSPTFSNVG